MSHKHQLTTFSKGNAVVISQVLPAEIISRMCRPLSHCSMIPFDTMCNWLFLDDLEFHISTKSPMANEVTWDQYNIQTYRQSKCPCLNPFLSTPTTSSFRNPLPPPLSLSIRPVYFLPSHSLSGTRVGRSAAREGITHVL